MGPSVSSEKEPWLDEPTCARISYYAGWLCIFAAITHAPALVAGFKIMPVVSRAGWLLIAFSLPAVLMLLVGGIALIYDKASGYYVVYAAILFGGIGGLSAPVIPGLKMLLKGNFYAEDIVLGTNLAVLLLLVYCQLQLIDSKRRAHVIAISLLLAFGLTHVIVVRTLIDRKRGSAAATTSVPYLGQSLEGLAVSGPVNYQLVYIAWQRSLTCVLSGKATEESMQRLATNHGLKVAPVERRDRLLPQAKAWKLDEQRFPLRFGADDICLVGRLKEHPRAVLIVGWRKVDQRFTAQITGFLFSEASPRPGSRR